MLSPIMYKPLAVAADTLLTVGTIPSTKISLFAPNDPSSPAATKVTAASFPDPSFIVPPFSARALLPM